MTLVIHDRSAKRMTCDGCGDEFIHVTGYVNDERGPYAVYFAACHGHPEHEAQIDIVFGTWGTEQEVPDHVTFSCRLRADSAMAVDAPLAVSVDAPRLGLLLTRTSALSHSRIGDFWSAVDLLAESDASVREAVYTASSDDIPGH